MLIAVRNYYIVTNMVVYYLWILQFSSIAACMMDEYRRSKRSLQYFFYNLPSNCNLKSQCYILQINKCQMGENKDYKINVAF